MASRILIPMAPPLAERSGPDRLDARNLFAHAVRHRADAAGPALSCSGRAAVVPLGGRSTPAGPRPTATRMPGRRRLLGHHPEPLPPVHVRPLPGRPVLADHRRRRSCCSSAACRCCCRDAAQGALRHLLRDHLPVHRRLAVRRRLAGCSRWSTPPLWGGLFLTLLISIVGIVASLPDRHRAGAGPALDDAGGQGAVRLVHRAGPRRAVGHRAVHGLGDAAAVLPAGLDHRQDHAGADRRRRCSRAPTWPR